MHPIRHLNGAQENGESTVEITAKTEENGACAVGEAHSQRSLVKSHLSKTGFRVSAALPKTRL